MDDIRPSTPATPQQPVPQQPMKHRSVVPLIVAFVVLLALALWIMSLWNRTKYDEHGNLIRLAPQGEVVSDFPRELLPAGAASSSVGQSYSVNYAGQGTRLPVVNYTSTKSFEENIADFRRLLKDEGWTILQDANEKTKPTTNIYAQKDTAEVNVTFTQKADNSVAINVAYSQKQ